MVCIFRSKTVRLSGLHLPLRWFASSAHVVCIFCLGNPHRPSTYRFPTLHQTTLLGDTSLVVERCISGGMFHPKFVRKAVANVVSRSAGADLPTTALAPVPHFADFPVVWMSTICDTCSGWISGTQKRVTNSGRSVTKKSCVGGAKHM